MLIAWFAAEASAADVQGHLSQARFFVKKGYLDDARRELEAASRLPDGEIDPDVWQLLATVRYQLLDIPGALAAADQAQTYARTEDQLYTSATLAAFLRENFGAVEVVPPYPGLTGRLDVLATEPPFDPELKGYLARREAQGARSVTFPVTVWLPAGRYELNGGLVDVQPDRTARVERSAADLSGSGLARLQLARFELGSGLSLGAGAMIAHHEPAPDAHIAVSQPVGRLIAGAFADWTPRWYLGADGDYRSAFGGWGAGARVGVEVVDSPSVTVRPSIGWRFARVPGVALPCRVGDGGAICEQSGLSDVWLYPTGAAHFVVFELSTDLIDRRRKRAVGLGVKAVGEVGVARVPAAGTFDLPDRGTMTWTADESQRAFYLSSVRFMPHLSVAF